MEGRGTRPPPEISLGGRKRFMLMVIGYSGCRPQNVIPFYFDAESEEYVIFA